MTYLPDGRLDRAVLLQSLGQCTLDTYRQAQNVAEQLVIKTEAFSASPTAATQAGRIVMSLGFVYGGKPAWGKFFTALASGELKIYREVALTPKR